MNEDPSKKILHIGSPNIGDREKFLERVRGILDCKQLTNDGELVREWERKLAAFLDVKYVVAVSNATTALQLAMRAMELSGEILLPSLTFAATAHAVQWLGLKPVFCDIDPRTYCLDPKSAEARISSKTSAILGVHLFSRPCDVRALQELADRRHLKLFFDAAQAFGVSYQGKRIGNFGVCEIFSFHATKVLNSFEGGAVATHDPRLAEKIRRMRNFGFTGMDQVEEIGINGKMSEVHAAMGLTNLESFPDFVQINRRNYHLYRQGFADVPQIKLMDYDESGQCNWQYVVAEIGGEFPLTRDELMKKLHAAGILVRRYFWPGCHRMEPYRSLDPGADRFLPRTREIAERLLLFPNGTSVTPEDIKRTINLVTGVVRPAAVLI